MPTLFRRSSGGSYYFKKQVKGRRFQVCTGKQDLAAARSFLSAWEAQHSGQEPTTIRQLIESYLESSKHLTRHTVVSNVSSLRSILKATNLTENSPVWSLTPDLIRQFQETAVKAGRSSAGVNATWRQAKSVLRAPCRWPLPDLRETLQTPGLRQGRKQWTAPEHECVRQTLNSLDNLREEDASAWAAFHLAFYLGLRKTEILNFDHSWVKDGYVIVGGASFIPKSGKDRVVPIPLGLCLDDFPKISEKATRRLNKWLRSQGWSGRMALHELRKYYGSRVAQECGLFVAQRLLGHAEPSTTSQSYASLLDLPVLDIYQAPTTGPRKNTG